jgi:hypothetical protein
MSQIRDDFSNRLKFLGADCEEEDCETCYKLLGA